jgi:hypothetical protein
MSASRTRDDRANEDREEEMVTVNVAQPFTFTHQDGTVERFRPGNYELPASIANHWYVQCHVEEDEGPRRSMRGQHRQEQRDAGSGRMKRGTPEHEQAMARSNYMETVDSQAEADEIARVTEEVRQKFRDQRARRPGERAKLNEDVRQEAEGESNAEAEAQGAEGGEGGEEGRSGGNRRR